MLCLHSLSTTDSNRCYESPVGLAQCHAQTYGLHAASSVHPVHMQLICGWCIPCMISRAHPPVICASGYGILIHTNIRMATARVPPDRTFALSVNPTRMLFISKMLAYEFPYMLCCCRASLTSSSHQLSWTTWLPASFHPALSPACSMTLCAVCMPTAATRHIQI